MRYAAIIKKKSDCLVIFSPITYDSIFPIFPYLGTFLGGKGRANCVNQDAPSTDR